jgi:hypothetical protein
MRFMPLIFATAFIEKAALAQGGFFVFTAKFLITPFFKSPNTCHCLPPRTSEPIAFQAKHMKRLLVVAVKASARLVNRQ